MGSNLAPDDTPTAIVRTIVSRHGGMEVRFGGGSFLCGSRGRLCMDGGVEPAMELVCRHIGPGFSSGCALSVELVEQISHCRSKPEDVMSQPADGKVRNLFG